MLTCRAMLEHTNESSGTQLTQHPGSRIQVAQHAKFRIRSGSDVACHVVIQFCKLSLDNYVWATKVLGPVFSVT